MSERSLAIGFDAPSPQARPSLTEVNPFSLYNASISRLDWDRKVKLMTLNQLDHLKAAELDRPDNTGNL